MLVFQVILNSQDEASLAYSKLNPAEKAKLDGARTTIENAFKNKTTGIVRLDFDDEPSLQFKFAFAKMVDKLNTAFSSSEMTVYVGAGSFVFLQKNEDEVNDRLVKSAAYAKLSPEEKEKLGNVQKALKSLSESRGLDFIGTSAELGKKKPSNDFIDALKEMIEAWDEVHPKSKVTYKLAEHSHNGGWYAELIVRSISEYNAFLKNKIFPTSLHLDAEQGEQDPKLRFVGATLKKKYEDHQQALKIVDENIVKLRKQQLKKPKDADLQLKIANFEKEREGILAGIEETNKEIAQSRKEHKVHSWERAASDMLRSLSGYGIRYEDFAAGAMGAKPKQVQTAENLLKNKFKGTMYEEVLDKDLPAYYYFSIPVAYLKTCNVGAATDDKYGSVGINYSENYPQLWADNSLEESIVHELAHYYFGGFRGLGRTAFGEAYTELFAQRICRENGIKNYIAYEPAVEAVFYLEQIAGKDVMERAYASGDSSELEKILDSKLGDGFFKKIMAFDRDKGCEEMKLAVMEAIAGAMDKGTIKGVVAYKPELIAEAH